MSYFLGTKSDFHKYLGGYCRNKVHSITNKARASHNKICEYCNKEAELQAAHMRGMERKEVIDLILEEFIKENDKFYTVDLNKFEKTFIEMHEPIEEHFYFLCSDCHRKYDAGKILQKDMNNRHNNSELSISKNPTEKDLFNTQNKPFVTALQIETNDDLIQEINLKKTQNEIVQNSVLKEKSMILVSKENFKNYLRKNGYKEWSDAGNETTIPSYIYWIEQVMKREFIETWSELTEHIQHLLRKYGEYGEMKNFGKEAHSTVINALKRFMEYLLNECNYMPKVGTYYN